MVPRRFTTGIAIHCSASDYGDVELFRKWHIRRGWDDIGYHAVVLNGRRTPRAVYDFETDGAVELGRPLDIQGAHVKGQNDRLLGLCFVSHAGELTLRQMRSGAILVGEWLKAYDLRLEDVCGHYQFDPGKTCPGFAVEDFREMASLYLKQGD